MMIGFAGYDYSSWYGTDQSGNQCFVCDFFLM